MNYITKEYLAQLSKKAFNGVPIYPLGNSLFQAGDEKIVITVSAPDTEHYVFGVNGAYAAKAAFVILGCKNDSIAFKLPADIFTTKLSFSQGRKTGRKITTVAFSQALLSWELVYKKDNKNHENRLLIDDYKIDLKDDADHMALCLGLRSVLFSK